MERPGSVLKSIRVKHGWTLTEASQKTGLSPSTLSKLENNKMSLTYDKLVAVTNGFGIEIADLFPSDGSSSAAQPIVGRRCVTRRGEGREIDAGSRLYRYVAAEILHKDFVPIYGEVRARSLAEFGDWSSHEGQEFVYVLEGIVEIHTQLYAPVRLEPGDSLFFDSTMPHAYLAGTTGRCAMLSINSAPEKALMRNTSRAESHDGKTAQSVANSTGGLLAETPQRRNAGKRAGTPKT
jgi:transcriptional regulator with XRE-family HTH domain